MNHETAKELLRSERTRLEDLLRHTAGDGLEQRAGASAPGDPNEPAGPRIAEQEENAVTKGLRARLERVKRAEQRLADGTYGLSIRSGLAIPDERLEADPAAELTVDEAAQG
jgi:DnaK suppressor protein